MIIKGLILIGMFTVNSIALDSLIDICFKHDSLDSTELNNKTIYKNDFDLDKRIDKIVIGEEYIVIDMNHKKIKESVLRLCDDECSSKVVTKEYICIGNIGTDYGDMYVYQYNSRYKNWLNIGDINKSPNNKSHNYKETYYLDLWSIDEKIYKIKGKNTLISLSKKIEELYKDKSFMKIKALIKSINIKSIDIRKNELTPYNNIAYYLQKAGSNEEAIYLLEKILKKYPNRTVAHYNLADAYWAVGEKKKAIASYTTYIEQMCNAGKEKRIPQVVRDRVSSK